MVEKEIYSQLNHLLGENWQGCDSFCLTCEGRVDVRIGRFIWENLSQIYMEEYGFVRKLENIFCLDQSFCDKWGGLPDPLIVFQVDQEREMVRVISHEDWFHHGGREPSYRLRKAWNESGEVDVDLQSELNRELLDWVKFLIEHGFRPKT